MCQTASQIAYSHKSQLHKIGINEEVILLLHQTHKGEPYTNIFSVSAYRVPPHLDSKQVIEELKKRKDGLSGYTRILIAKTVD